VSEAKLWEDIQQGMTARWHCQRHEDKYSTGIPDVSFGIQKRSEGWIELKWLNRLPEFNGKPWDFKYDHFTSDQRNWLEMRTRHGGGRVFLLCRFGADLTCVWNWNRVRTLLGAAPLEDIIKAANAQWWHSGIDFEELEHVLANNRIIQPRYRL
jgi:hypothetical protein